MTVSARNPQVARLRRLARIRREREREGMFVVEGATLVAEARRSGIEIETVFVADRDRVPAGSSTYQLVADLRHDGSTVVEVTSETLDKAVSTVSPQPLVAIARRPSSDLQEAMRAGARLGFLLVLVDVADPGNAGTLVRSAEAAGAGGVVFCGAAAVDPFNPKVVRASAGAIFNTVVATSGPSEKSPEPAQVLQTVAEAGLHRLATVVRGGDPYDHLDLCEPVAVVMGNEAHGLPPELLAVVDWQVSIPMVGRAESLNVAMAGTVVCFELLRQRRAASPGGFGEPSSRADG